MLESGKLCSSATIATALTVSSGNQISFKDYNAKLPSHSSNVRYTCSPDNLYAVPKTDIHGTKWVSINSIETEVSRFVASSSTITTTARNHFKKCQTSTSSGYSSHSPPLSTGSYSYTSAVYGKNFTRNVPLTMKDQSSGNLAIIHESETIPRPIWPSTFSSSPLYTCWGCGCTYSPSYCNWNCEKSPSNSAHEVLLELSQTLNSMIESKKVMTPEEISKSISQKVAQGIGAKGGIYEYIYHNSSFLRNKKSFMNEPNSHLLNSNKNASTNINPVNSKLYSNTRHFYMYNPTWLTCLCNYEHAHRFVTSFKNDEQVLNKEPQKQRSSVAAALVDDDCRGIDTWSILQNTKSTLESHACEYLNYSTTYYVKAIQNAYKKHRVATDTKKAIYTNEEVEHSQNKITSNEPEYAVVSLQHLFRNSLLPFDRFS